MGFIKIYDDSAHNLFKMSATKINSGPSSNTMLLNLCLFSFTSATAPSYELF